MNRLTVVLPYHAGDLAAATRLLNWIHELDTPRHHNIMLVADSGVDQKDRDTLKENAARSFLYAGTLPVAVPAVGFPPNHMFLAAGRQIQYGNKHAWLWLEPDCVPLKSCWLDQLADEYAGCPHKFMGQIIRSDQPGLPAVHLTGCSVYSPDAYDDVYSKIESLKGQQVAWDMEAAAIAVPRADHTESIQHFWGKPGFPPTFVMHKEPGRQYAENVMEMSFLRPSAVLFHRCKDDSLITMLKLQRQAQKIREGRQARQDAEAAAADPVFDPETDMPPKPEPNVVHRGRGRPRKTPQPVAA